MVALIVIPTAVALVLGGLRVYEGAVATVTHAHIVDRAEIGVLTVQLANQLGLERSVSAVYISDDADPDERSSDMRQAMEEERDNSRDLLNTLNARLDEMGEADGELAQNRLQAMQNQLESLDSLRTEVDSTRITVLPVVTKYRTITRAMADFNQTIADETEDTDLRESVRALTALSNARDQLSYESALMAHSLARNSMSGGISEAIDSSRARYESEIANFTQAASTDQRTVFDENFTGLEVSQVSTMRMRVMYRAERGDDLTGVTANDGPEDYQETANTALDRLQSVEEEVAEGVAADSENLRDAAMGRALLDTVVVAALLLAVFLLTSLVVRSLVRPLRTLEDGARRVAERDLPDSITRMQEGGTSPDAPVKVDPIEVHSQDEIGEVARAFDDVHRVALTLASDEAALRSNVNAMFVNLSRRSQTLVERQLRLIDGLEQSEQDSDRLSDLFQLDHLATRMRRNNENLLVLSGQDNTRKWAQPVPLVDVLRGAISEVEQYDRVNVRAPSHISVLGRPVNDVIHLVAELVENATAFSPHDTEVLVNAKTLDSGAVRVDVTDSGIGMAADELAAVNARLAAPPVIDVAVSRRMGLFVVSRLAHRHGIRLELSEAHGGGTTAGILFPPDLLITPVDGQNALGDGGARPELTAGAPDTFAEAEAAFAATPAAEEPDPWQAQDGGESSGDFSGLPKRNPGSNRADEHPPSGQDLWNTGGNAPEEPEQPTWETTRGSGATSAVDPQQDQSIVDPYDYGVEEDDSRQESAGGSLFDPPKRRGHGGGGHDNPVDSGTFRRVEEAGAFGSDGDTYDAFGGPSRSGPDHRDTGSHQRPEPSTEGFPAVSGRETPEQQTPQYQQPPQEAPQADQSARDGYGSTAYLSRRYGGAQSADSTVVPPSPGGQGVDDSLPIFDAIESNWFKRRTGGPTVDATETGPMPQVDPVAEEKLPESPPAPETTQAGPESEQEWNSAADRGWQAARTAAEPLAGGLTTSGLPKRVPKANLVPGTAPKPENVRQVPTRSADRVRSRFSGFQRGVREGRNRIDEGPQE
ncbi:sensor histidine kinase [Nocardiopsis kunsanensis]|uniref:sensor histidine kinase n=1 Tax=Nocardiopsis kunsanensis TaxID=141693 RepID=UPI000380A25D